MQYLYNTRENKFHFHIDKIQNIIILVDYNFCNTGLLIKNEINLGERVTFFLIGVQSSHSLSSNRLQISIYKIILSLQPYENRCQARFGLWGSSLQTSATQQSEQQINLCIPKKNCSQFYHELTEK